MKYDCLTNINFEDQLAQFALLTDFPNTVLISPGETDYNIYFILNGFGTIYGINGKGDKKYLYLQKESRLLCSLTTLAYGKPSEYCYEIQKGGQLAVIDDRQLMRASREDPAINEWYIGLLKKALVRFEEKTGSFIMHNSKERLMRLHSEYPEIFTEALNKQIATYIGISPEHLSRILSSPLLSSGAGGQTSRKSQILYRVRNTLRDNKP